MNFFKRFEFIALLAALTGLSAFGIDAVLPAFPEFVRAFSLVGERSNEVQLVVYVFMFGFSATQLFFGVLADFFGRRRLLLAGLFLYTAASCAVWFVDSFSGLLWARFFQGVGLSAPRVLAQAVVRDVSAGREMSRIMSFSMMVFLLVPILAPGVGQLVLAAVGDWHGIFYLFVFCGLGMMAWVGRRLPETLPPHKRNPPNLHSLRTALTTCFTHPPTRMYMGVLCMMFSMMMTYIGQAEQIYGSSVYALGDKFALAFAVTALGMVAASFTNTRIVMRLGMRTIVRAALAAMFAVDTLLLSAAFYFSGRPPLLLFMALLMLHLFCSSLSMPNLNSLILEPHGRISGTIAAVAGSLMSVVGLLIAHLVASRFNGTVFPLAFGWVCLSALANIGNWRAVQLTVREATAKPL